MKIVSLLYLTSLLFLHSVFSQETEKALIQLTKAKHLLQSDTKVDSAYYWAKKCLTTFEKQKKDSLALNTTYYLFLITTKIHQEQNAFYQNQIDIKAKKTTNKAFIADIYTNIASYYYDYQNDDLAMKYRLKADSVYSKNNIKNMGAVSNLTGIAQLLMFSKKLSHSRNFDRAETYVLKAIKMAEEIQNDVMKGAVYEKYANLKSIQKNYPVAKKYLFKSLTAAKKAKDTLRESSVYWNFAIIQTIQNQKDSATYYYKKRIQILENSTQTKELAVAFFNLGEYYNRSNQYNKAISYLEKALELFQQKVDHRNEFKINTLVNLSKAYQKTNQSYRAYETLTLANQLKDSLTLANNDKQVLELETKYQTEKKEQEIKLLAAQNRLEKNKVYIFISIVILLLITGLFLFFSYKNKLKFAQKLKELNTLKSRFFANISHEFRTPLTLIKSPIQSLQNEISDENQLAKLNLIDTNSNRMLELINQLLELSKIDDGNLKLLFKEGNLSHFFTSIVEPFTFQSKETGTHFKVALPKTQKNHFFDKDVIEKITTNLLSNAFKYTPKNENIHLNALIENETLTITISNTGSQLIKEDLAHLFERFYQKKETNLGFGIGLALVKELVSLYKGSIETELENGKLSFIVRLPLDKNNENAILLDQKNDKKTIENKIETNSELPIVLIVDDNKDIRKLIGDIVKDHYNILEAENGEDALDLAQKEIPDCIISDIMMPKMDGFELTKALKRNELTSFIPVILLTANSTETTHLESVKSAADAFLTKPFNNEIVKETLAQLLAERKKLQERYSQELILKPTDIIVDSYDEKFINKLQNILDKNLSNPDFTAENFANEANLSRMQLHRKLKTLFGVSATEFIRNERIKLAHDLLKKSTSTVSEVAYAVGFNEVTYFSKCFKEFYNISPSEYQKSK